MQTYLLKLARSGEDGEKIFLLLESGIRFHTTEVGHWLIFVHTSKLAHAGDTLQMTCTTSVQRSFGYSNCATVLLHETLIHVCRLHFCNAE